MEKRNSILRKIVLILIICFLAPMLYQSLEINVTVNHLVEDKVLNTAYKSLENSALYISSILQTQFDTANYYRLDESVIAAAERMHEQEEEQRYQTQRRIVAKLINGNNIERYKYPYYFMILDYHGNMMTNYTYSPYGDYADVYEQIAQCDWFSRLQNSFTEQTVMFGGTDFLNSHGTRKFYVATNIIYNENVGVLIIGTDENSIASQFYNALPEGSSFVVNDKGEYMVRFSNDSVDYSDEVYQNLGQLGGNFTGEKNGGYTITVEQKSYQVFWAPVVVKGISDTWAILSIVPLERLKEDIWKIRGMNGLVLILYAAGIAGVILLLNQTIVKPIRRLGGAVNEVRDGNLTVQIEKLPNNELGQLGEGFNVMTQYLSRYFTDLKRHEEEKRVTEIRLLQSQIKPHFVRNVLNTIRWMAEINGVSGISRSVMALSNLLEYNFQNSEMSSTVSEELEYVKTYLYLQKVRFQNKFRDEYEIDEELLDQPILKLSFQPVVENAIYHGLMKKEGLGVIKITAVKAGRQDDTGKDMLIMIQDDGVGMEQEEAEKILEPPRDQDIYHITENTENIALWNINQRMQRRYGEAYRLQIFSKAGEGTRC